MFLATDYAEAVVC